MIDFVLSRAPLHSGPLLVARLGALTILSLFVLVPAMAAAVENPGKELQEVGVSTKLGGDVDLTLSFTDDTGTARTLGEIAAQGKPVVFIPVYYSCPRLCGLVLSGVTTLLNSVNLQLGTDYQVVTLSFDSSEGVPLARKRSEEYRAKLSKSDADRNAWHFWIGKEEQIARLMDQIGFRYKRDGGEFAHSAAIIILTPQGKISQYFTGIEFSPWDVRLSLIDASQGAVGSAIDHVLLYCFRFDPTKGRYTLAAMNVMKLGGVLSLIALGTVIFLSARKA